MSDIRSIVSLILGLVVAVYALDAYFCRTKHSNEPKYIRPSIPLIGHAIGLMRYGGRYYSIIGEGQPEIYTLPIMNLRLYVSNSRHLTPVIQKHSKTLSFKPFARVASERFSRTSPYFLSLHDEPHTFLNDTFRGTRNALAPGKGLDHQNMGTGESVERFIFKLEQDVSNGGTQTLPFYKWIKHVLVVASTDGVYGEKNPFRNSEIEENFWTWARGAPKMTIGFPSIFLRSEYRALSIMSNAFEKYCLTDHHDAADVIHSREDICKENKVSISDTARGFVGFNIALLGNSVPTAFWAVYDIISRPDVLEAVRKELQLNAVTSSGPVNQRSFDFDVVALRTKCPLLLSSYQETQRFRNIHASIRKVVADTTIDSLSTGRKYFLAKGNYVQIPSITVHYDDTVWGNDSQKFDPYRFVKDNATIPRDQLSESYALMAWGVAPHVCPARQFASTEVMLLVAMLVLRFNFEDPHGKWVEPDLASGEFSTVMPPKEEVFLSVKQRDGWQGAWNLKMGDSTAKIPLASG